MPALATGAAFFVSWPVHDPALWSLDPFNVGVKELDVAETLPALPGTAEERERNRADAEVELRRADAHLRRAYAFVQGDPGSPSRSAISCSTAATPRKRARFTAARSR